ncbi:MAG TPA: deoxyribose-phosphate aldolase [Candidatus Dormibacteraeota bacterium]
MTVAATELLARLTEIRATDPGAVQKALAKRGRRPLLQNSPPPRAGEGQGGGSLFLVAADHPARGVLKVGSDSMAMADRGELLRRLLIALERPGVDGILGTADIIEDLALLGALENKVVFGSMNRGGLTGFRFELDDRFTAYTADGIVAAGLDGGKMMVRVADEPETLRTLAACAHAIDELSARKLPAMVEVFASHIEEGRLQNRDDADSLIRAIAIVSGLGTTSAYLWLKLPAVDDLERVMRSTSLPTLLLGGDPGEDQAETFVSWRRAMAIPQVRGLVAGRSLLYPRDGDVAQAVDAAAAIVAGRRR